MAWTVATIAAVATAVAAVGGTAYSIATAPGTPEPPPKPIPPPPPPGVQPPVKKAPTPVQADAGVAGARRERQRAFGLEQTILAVPKLGNVGGDLAGPATKLGRRGTLF